MIRPYLPEARILQLPGRGETFVRVGPHHPGAATLLLLHGWTATADLNWFAAYQPLASRFNLIAIDHRGHGRGLRSPHPFALEAAADDAAAALDVLGAPAVIAVGFSMGGPIGLQLSRRHPERVNGLVLSATALEWRRNWRVRLRWRLLALFVTALRFDWDNNLLQRLIDEVAAEDELVAAWREHLIGEGKRLETADARSAGKALSRYDARPFAELLEVPAAVVVTTADRLVPAATQHDLARALAARIVELEGDHDVFLRRPDAFASALVTAVDSVAARLTSPVGPRSPAPGPDGGGPRLAWLSERRRRRQRRRAGSPAR